MKNIELKRLKREQLIDIIYQLQKNHEELQNENLILKKQLEERQIIISEAGSIANAAVEITDIFKNAQDAADLYLREVMRNCSEVRDAEAQAAGIIDDAKKKAHKIRQSAIVRYTKRQSWREKRRICKK